MSTVGQWRRDTARRERKRGRGRNADERRTALSERHQGGLASWQVGRRADGLTRGRHEEGKEEKQQEEESSRAGRCCGRSRVRRGGKDLFCLREVVDRAWGRQKEMKGEGGL